MQGNRTLNNPGLFWSFLWIIVALFVVINSAWISGFFSKKTAYSLSVRALYNFNTLQFPALLLVVGLYGLWLGRESPGVGVNRVAVAALVTAAICVLLRIYATHIEPRILKVRHVTIRTPKLSRGVRLLHLTDLETDFVRNHEPKVFARIRELNPDLLINTGDILSPRPPGTYESELPKMLRLFASVRAPLGKFNVPGESDEAVRAQLSAETDALITLDSREREVRFEGGRIRILGLSVDESSNESDVRAKVSQWLEGGSADDLTIVAGHRPDFVLSIQELPIDLCLAGHTHGGQVRIPFFGAIITFSEIPRKWARGFRQVGNTRLNVSAGVGFEHGAGIPALRFNCPPEMTLIHFHPSSEQLNRTAKYGAPPSGGID